MTNFKLNFTARYKFTPAEPRRGAGGRRAMAEPPSGEATTAARAVANTSADTPLQLFTSWFCPYAQRAWIALEESGADYRIREIQPYLLDAAGRETKTPKPIEQKAAEFPEFVECSPAGLVPALLRSISPRATARVHESLVCVEYVDRHYASGALGSGDADVRRGVAVAEEQILPNFYRLLMEQEQPRRDAAAEAIRAGLLAWVAARPPGAAEGGPFFTGARFTAADIALCPWWPQRLEWIAGAYRAFELPEGALEYAPLRVFAEAVRARPAVQRTLVSRERLVRNYTNYADGSASSAVAKAFRREGAGDATL